MTKVLIRTVAILLAVAFILYDATAPIIDNDTLENLYDWTADWTVIPWVIGLFAGHSFWPYNSLVPKSWRYCLLFDVFLALIAVNVLYGGMVEPALAVWIGLACGGFVWGTDCDEDDRS